MFALDHCKDFDAILAADEPFALVRFGDGEAAIMSGKAHKAASDEWTTRDGSHWLAGDLHASLTRAADRYCVGLPSGCCLPMLLPLHNAVQVPRSQRTFATIFLHGNLSRMGELVERYKPVVVGPGAEISVPAKGIEAPFDLDTIVAQMLEVDRPMFVVAGPLANVIVDRYWQRQKREARQVVIDVGSAYDFFRTGTKSRYYHGGDWLRRHHCSISFSTAKDRKMITTNTNANATVIGRRGQSLSNRGARPAAAITRRSGGLKAVATTGQPATVTALPNGRKPGCAKCARVVRRRK